ncbi:exonuclease domain-containing protein [Streptomyces sp. AC1-42T]|uniref:exonuclease domain-containing protein n=1 Tax=Streptomyces sp. AC1-42T TaxID=2218665 RepID=UPI0011B93DDB|nr:exonuclease domain-containing protein [Streptomyces sp. AC1-42T]
MLLNNTTKDDELPGGAQMTETAVETAPQDTAAPEKPLPEALGAQRIAALLAEHLDVPVTADDVTQLVELQHLEVHDWYKRWALYSTKDALALDPELVKSLVAERTAWQAVSITRNEAVARIGWHWRDIARMGDEGRVKVGRFGRYLTADIDRLPLEAEGERHVTGQLAAKELEIRYPTDLRYVEAAGWLTPVTTMEMPAGTSRYRTVTVPLYRLADVRAVREIPGVDWAAARNLAKGVPSPLRAYAAKAPTRAATVRAFAQALADQYGVTVWAWSSPYTGGWEMDWERRDGAPTQKDVAARLKADPAAGAYAEEITLCPAWGRITRRARQLLEPGAAVVLDTETTDLYGRTVEVAVVDAETGRKLMDTLVQPEAPITDGAFWVHGISDEDLVAAKARTFDRILPRLRKVTKGRVICAYNEEFDRTVVTNDARRVGKRPMHLAEPANWFCLMKSYATWLGSGRWLALGGGHRALGDATAARNVLVEMAAGRGTPFTPRPPAPDGPVPEPPTDSTLKAVVPEQTASTAAVPAP